MSRVGWAPDADGAQFHIIPRLDHHHRLNLLGFLVFILETDKLIADVQPGWERCRRVDVLCRRFITFELLEHPFGVGQIGSGFSVDVIHRTNQLTAHVIVTEHPPAGDAIAAVFKECMEQVPVRWLVEGARRGAYDISVFVLDGVVISQMFGQIADFRLAGRFDPDDGHRPRDVLTRAAPLKAEHPVDFDSRTHGFDIFANLFPNATHLQFGIGGTVHADRFDDHVGQDPVNALAHLSAEPGHDAVDHDHRGYAEHHADDARQGNVAGPQIPGTEEQFVHEPVLGEMRSEAINPSV